VQACHNSAQSEFAGGLRDSVEFGFEWCESFLIDPFFIHAGLKVVTDLLVERVAICCWFGSGFENLPGDDAVGFVEFVEAAPDGAFRGDRIVLHPHGAGMLIEIIARGDGAIEHLGVERLRGQHRGGEEEGLEETHPISD